MVDYGKIKVLVLDVDGVLTDGGIIVGTDGSEMKKFNSLDGHGIKMWQRAGNIAAFLSGRTSAPTEQRARQLEVEYCLQECHDKLVAFNKLAADIGVDFLEIAYIGDDLPDLPPMRAAGFSAAAANAVEEVRKSADYVTKRRGGDGAVREVIEYLLKRSEKWEVLMQRYIQ